MKNYLELAINNKNYLMETENTRKTERLIDTFLTKLARHLNNNKNLGVYNDPEVISYFMYRTNIVTLEKHENHVCIVGKYSRECIPNNDIETTIIYL